MRGFSIPAAYVPFVKEELARIQATIARDRVYRSADDAVIREYAPVPAEQISVAEGRVSVMIIDATTEAVAIPIAELPDHLHAFGAATN